MTETGIREKFRPQFHFTPEANWMNDPNGMVYYEGEYHLFYQYYPEGTTWGPMHWGHAVSPDLVHWEHLPVALAPDEHGFIFSGSAVVDWNDTSGLFGGGSGLVAIYTQHDTHPETGLPRQRQSIAYSTDKGRSWIAYPGNPVLTEPIADFRDPKVFWHEPTASWIMVLAVGEHIRLYRSPDLKSWTLSDKFGAAEGSHDGVWECPDLIKLPVDGEQSASKWVLLVSIGDNPNCPEGSRTQYFIGEFDGYTFRNDYPAEQVLWLDHGRDNYAGVTWSDIPSEDGRRLFIGWMSNWKYANLTPTATWRGAMTIPRELVLMKTTEGLRVGQRPAAELQRLRLKPRQWMNRAIVPENPFKFETPQNQLEIRLDILLGAADEVGIVFRSPKKETAVVGYNVRSGSLFIDRTSSGTVDFHEQFGCRHEARLQSNQGRLQLHLYLDRSSLEVFANHGEIAMTDLIFPEEGNYTVSIYSAGGKATVNSLEAYDLKSIHADAEALTEEVANG